MTEHQEQSQESDEDLLHGGKVMSIWDHLGELRTRVVRSMISILVVFFASFSFAAELVTLLSRPLCAVTEKEGACLNFFGPLDPFVVNLKVSFLAGIVCASPFWLYQFWKFFEPALYPKERKYILPFTFASATLFLSGCAFSFFVILPMALEFLLTYGAQQANAIIGIKEYMSMLMMLTFGFGLIFETPVVLILLAMLDLISAETLREYRRFVLVGILVAGALLTPPDPISQVMMAVPVYLMFEASIIIISFIQKRPKPEAAAS